MSNYRIKCLENLLPLSIRKNVLSHSVSRLTAPGENYGSLMLKVDIRVLGKDSKEEFISLVAKCVPKNKALQAIFNVEVTFRNEIAWYTEVIPLFQKFQKIHNITNILDCFPKYYGSRLSLNSENNIVNEDGTLLLENMIVQGYEMASRFEGFDLEMSYNLLEILAEFHAVGLALKIKTPNDFQRKIMPHITNYKDDPENFSTTLITYLEKEKPEYEIYIGRIKKAVLSRFKGDKGSDDIWKTALHNDFWINNILFKKQQNVKIAILDFQIATYGSITLDLIFFLVTSVNTLIAKKHFGDLLEHYFQQLLNNLNYYGIKLEKFNYKGFMEELKINGPSAFARAVFALLIVLNERGKSIENVDDEFDPNGLVEVLKQNLTEKQKEKFCFLVEEFAKRDWI